jgi:hypothetical protein
MLIETVYAHHKGVDHGNAGGNKNKEVPEINGPSLILAVLAIICVWKSMESFVKKKDD